MGARKAEVAVAGHICLDVIPVLTESVGTIQEWLVPGKLVQVGPVVTSTGGAVSNTGLALHRLGVPTKLIGKVGDDLFGNAILDRFRQYDTTLVDSVIIAPGEQSSYSIVISPPNVDRVFLHCPGTNDTFDFTDVDLNDVASTRLFHFGYPPLMKKMYEKNGTSLVRLLSSVKQLGLTITLDMAKPDLNSEASRADWVKILESALPYVDFFLPSFEEILFMLHGDEYGHLLTSNSHEALTNCMTPEVLAKISDTLISMGTAAVLIKLGEHGIYFRSSKDADRWQTVGACAPQASEDWIGRELLAPVFEVSVSGTTGAGDSTIAGFLSGIVKGLSLEDTLTAAVAVGACNVEKADAVSGIPKWEEVQSRIAKGWQRRPVTLTWDGWTICERTGLSYGTDDRGKKPTRSN